MAAPYQAPLRDMHFLLNELVDFKSIAQLPGYEEAADVVDPILEEAANFATSVLDPLNVSGDREGAKFNDGNVTTPKGFKEAFHQFADAGWIGLPLPAEYGGQACRKCFRPRRSRCCKPPTWHSPTGRCSIRARSKRSCCAGPTSRKSSSFRS